MKLAIGRIATVLVVAGGWLVAGMRTVLDLIGYATVPEDAQLAAGLLRDFLMWFLSVPWWIPWGFALICTLSLMRISWSRTQQQVAVSASPSAAIDTQDELTAFDERKREFYKAWDGVDPMTMTEAAYLWDGQDPGKSADLTGTARAKYITLAQGAERGEITFVKLSLDQVLKIKNKKFGLLVDALISRKVLREFIDKNDLRPAPFVFKEDRP